MQRVVIFLSSTFRDMTAERDHLLKQVFPRLEHDFGLRGIRLSIIDLRWGINSETSEVETIRRCLELVGECKPYFMAIIGGRYGYVPPTDILPALSPPFKRPPLSGTSVTELEILRFFEAVGDEPQTSQGLFFFARRPKFEGPDDEHYIRTLRARLASEAEAGKAEIHEYSSDPGGLKELEDRVFAFFQPSKLALDENAPSKGFPPSVTPAYPKSVIRAWEEYANARRSLAEGCVVVVDASDTLLRTAFIERVAQDHVEDAGVDAEYVHIMAKGASSSVELRTLLEERRSKRKRQHATGLLAMDGLDALGDWSKSPDIDTLATSNVLLRLWELPTEGEKLILGADWTSRRSQLENFPNTRIIDLNRKLFESAYEVLIFFKENFGKELTEAQASIIHAAALEKQMESAEFMLLCDRVRRFGELKPEGISQDQFLLERIGSLMPERTGEIVASSVSELLATAPKNRKATIRDAISVICASRYGVSLFDVQEMGGANAPLTAYEWAFLRGHLGPLLLGTTGRIRCIDNSARELMLAALGTDAHEQGKKRLLNWIIHRAITAKSLEDLLDPDRVMAMDLRWLIEDWSSHRTEDFQSTLLHPALWLSLSYHDWMHANANLGLMFGNAPASEAPPSTHADPWLEVDQFCNLVSTSRRDSDERNCQLFDALDKAELLTNTAEHYAGNHLPLHVTRCGLALRRSLVLLQKKVDKKSLCQSLDWAIALSRHRFPTYPEAAKRAWTEFSVLLVVYLRSMQIGPNSTVNVRNLPFLTTRIVENEAPCELDSVIDDIRSAVSTSGDNFLPASTVQSWALTVEHLVHRCTHHRSSDTSDGMTEILGLLDA